MLILTLVLLFICSLITFLLIIRKKHMHLWLGHYLKRKITLNHKTSGTKHIMFCFVDHYEPMWGKNISYEQECARVER